MNRWLFAIGIVAVLVIAMAGFWVWRSLSPPVPRPSPLAQKEPPKPEPGMTLEGVEGLVLRREGRKTWELFVDIITLDKNQTQATAQGIRKAIYYDEKGKPLLWFSARSLVYNGNTGEVTLTGDIQVEARLPKGRMLVGKATQAVWHERRRFWKFGTVKVKWAILASSSAESDTTPTRQSLKPLSKLSFSRRGQGLFVRW